MGCFNRFKGGLDGDKTMGPLMVVGGKKQDEDVGGERGRMR